MQVYSKNVFILINVEKRWEGLDKFFDLVDYVVCFIYFFQVREFLEYFFKIMDQMV